MTENMMTADDLAAAKAELAELETTERKAIAERIKIARDFGDLKENSEYHDAKDEQGHLEARIARLEEKIRNAVIVDEQQGEKGCVNFGSTVEFRDDQGRSQKFRLVASREAKPAEGLLSADSPVGQALLGLRVGQKARVKTPSGERALEVLAIG